MGAAGVWQQGDGCRCGSVDDKTMKRVASLLRSKKWTSDAFAAIQQLE